VVLAGLMDIRPNTIDILLLPGETCTKLGNYDAAAECSKETVKVDPTSGEAHLSLGNREKN
jgi:hypothetical protein